MINQLSIVGVLLGSIISPVLNAETSESTTGSSASVSTYSLTSTGETFLESENVWCGDNDLYRSYICQAPLSDPFKYLDTTIASSSVKWVSQKWVSYGTTQKTKTLNASFSSFALAFSAGQDDTYAGTLGADLYDYDRYAYMNASTAGRGYYYENVYAVPLGSHTLEYWQNILDFSIMEITRYAPYNASLDNYAVETASICRPTITISEYEADSTYFQISIRLDPSSFRIFFYQDGTAVTSYPSSTSTSSISTSLVIYPTSWIKTNSYVSKWPIYQRNLFSNKTSYTFIAGSEYALSSSTTALYGPKIGRGYYGVVPWYYGEEITNVNTMRSVGFCYLSPDYLASAVGSLKGSYTETLYETDTPIYMNKLEYNFTYFVCGSMDWTLYTTSQNYMCGYSVNESEAVYKIIIGPYSSGGETSSDGGSTDDNGNIYYVYDFTSFWWKIIAIPFAFISQAFNVTLFEGTPFAINVVSVLFTIVAVILIVALTTLLLKAFKK